MVYQQAGQPEAAEDAYRKSLAIEVRLGDVAGQADTLIQLGNLYYVVLARPEEAAAFYRQAADKHVETGDAAAEGLVRNNLADTLRKLRRLDEARQEIRRAIECKAQFGHAAQPWTSWSILADIETDDGNPAADGRISLAVTQSLLAGDAPTAASLLQQLAADSDLPSHARTFIRALQAIVAGRRDRTLAEAPDMYYRNAAEILFLIETLEKPR